MRDIGEKVAWAVFVCVLSLGAYLLILDAGRGLPTRGNFIRECAAHQAAAVCEKNADALFGKED